MELTNCPDCGKHALRAQDAEELLKVAERELKVVTQRLEAERMRSEAIENDLNLSDQECKRLRRVAQGYQQARSLNREEEPDWPTVKGLLQHWQRVTNHLRAQIPADGARAELVRKALKRKYDGGATPAEEAIRQAFDGLGAKPFAGKMGRSSTRYAGAKRFDDVEHALRDEVQLAKARALWQESDWETPPVVQLEELRSQTLPGLRDTVRELSLQVAKAEAWEVQERAEIALMHAQLDQLGVVNDDQGRFGVAA